jgi:prepilin-type N-terminal cleavage/methylation domain-containing protein
MRYVHATEKQDGFSLVETIVAIAILLLALVGPLTIAAKGIQAGEYSKEQTIALYLAQEGVEAFVAARNDAEITHVETSGSSWSWSWIPAVCTAGSGCGIDYRDSAPLTHAVSCNTVTNCALYRNDSAGRAKFLLPGQGGVSTEFTRVINITVNADGSRTVKATVTWVGTLFNTTPQSLSLTRALYQTY